MDLLQAELCVCGKMAENVAIYFISVRPPPETGGGIAQTSQEQNTNLFSKLIL